jgi:peptide/nickel transport system permease protein
MPGWQFVLRRLLQAIPLMLGVIVLTFVLVHLAPGDPALMLAGESGATTAEILAAVRAEYGLDRSLPAQLGIYLGKVAVGNFGFSYSYQRPVIEMVLERVPATLLLVGTATLLAMLFGVTVGVLAASRPSSVLVTGVDILSLFGYATPIFWTGIILLLLFSVYLPWFPSHGMSSVGVLSSGRWSEALDVGHHLVLPTITLGIVYLALYSRLMRASMLEVLSLDFVRTARAKGLNELTVVGKHALRNAFLPVLTVTGIQVGQVLAGAVLVETVFAWPGMGRLLLDSILRRDYPLLIGIVCLSSLAVIVVNLLTDLVYGALDPRIRYG